ncbi:MAG: hypothetical protein PVH17_03110 [Anaerolineae bacterium]|jgi:hypothetical protein
MTKNNTLRTCLQWGALLATGAALVLGLRLLTEYIPFASDWERYFQPITRGWLQGNLTLYQSAGRGIAFWNPPWLLWPLVPLAVWPVWVGWGLLVVGTLILMIWLTKGYQKRWLVFLAPLIIDLILDAPAEIIPMLGIALGWLAVGRPHLVGLALVLMAAKPQSCFLVALWVLLTHRRRFKSLLVPTVVFFVSLAVHGWDWPLRWTTTPQPLNLISRGHNITPWRSIGLWMIPVAVVLGAWAVRLPRTRRNLGALVAANALITPYMGSYSLVHVLTFSLLPLGTNWAIAGWLASCTVFLRFWFGQQAVRLDFVIAAILMIGYLLQADRCGPPPLAGDKRQ